ncbi:hypothetical protein [Streptomyces silvensis]|uniref:Uncharacterized protein n=1 Tax=Streptomyces silvensis TaxID=1765722 RepID=A0A0W7X389_9ACTN|nr:hypothetical protein [Streptomyces silvensis]KUF17369.1 hypothetical protein AT728_16335 [Streptomyces silvensis]
MPKKQPTAAKKARAAARSGAKYTAALRAAGDAIEDTQTAGPDAPPVLVPIATRPCPTGCDGSAHRGAVCRAWRPKDARRSGGYRIVQAATLGSPRAHAMGDRYEPTPEYHTSMGREAWFVLALTYTMLTDHQPHLVPGPDRLRAAVEAGDLAAVDALMEPLDREAARLLTKDAARWWDEVHPALDVYADHAEHEDREAATWEEAEALDERDRLVQRWRYTWTPRQNSAGYWDPPGTIWLAPKGWLDEHLTGLHGGHAPGTRLELTDGRPVSAYACRWGEAGPPVAYRVRDLVPGTHGNTGTLVPSLTGEHVVAADEVARPLA